MDPSTVVILEKLFDYITQQEFVPFLVRKEDELEMFLYHKSRKQKVFDKASTQGYEIVTEFKSFSEIMNNEYELLDEFLSCAFDLIGDRVSYT